MKLGLVPLLFCLVFPLLNPAPLQAEQAAPPGEFRGLAWATELRNIPDMVPVPARNCKDTYFRKNEELTFGKAEIESVAYYFADDKLYGAGVAFKGETNLFMIKDSLIQLYGPGRQAGTKYGWMWKGFSLVVDYDGETGLGSVNYRYEPPSAKSWKRPDILEEQEGE